MQPFPKIEIWRRSSKAVDAAGGGRRRACVVDLRFKRDNLLVGKGDEGGNVETVVVEP